LTILDNIYIFTLFNIFFTLEKNLSEKKLSIVLSFFLDFFQKTKKMNCFRCHNGFDNLINICITCRGMYSFCRYSCPSTFHRGNDGTGYLGLICENCYLEIHTSHLCVSGQCEHEDSCEEIFQQTQKKIARLFALSKNQSKRTSATSKKGDK